MLCMAGSGVSTGASSGSFATAKDVTIELIVAGDGEHYPKAGQLATIHYTAYCANGELFDSTRTRGRPFRFRVGEEQVVEGLEKAVMLLSVGERAKAVIPSAYAYGAQGFPGKVPPNMDLIFDLELLALN